MSTHDFSHGPFLAWTSAALIFCACAAPPRAAPARAAGPRGTAGSSPSAGGAPVAGAAGAQDDEAGSLVHGYVATQYRYRTAEDASDTDQDLWLTVGVDIGDEEKDPISAHLLGRALADLDGDRDEDEFFSFTDVYDSYDNSLHGELYHAYVDFHDVDHFDKLRLGRQLVYDTPELAFFDGVRLESEDIGEREVRWGVYGGVPVHLFESSSEGDRIFGALVEGRLWEGATGRVDYMHLEDERVTDLRADLIGLRATQALGDKLLFEAENTRLDGDSRDLRVRGTYSDVGRDLTVQGWLYQLFEQQRDLVTELDPFTNSLKTLEPYNQGGVLVSKGVGEHVLLDAGGDLRRVAKDQDEGEFNHDFDRYYLTATVHGLPRSTAVSVTGERWDGKGNDVGTVGLDVSTEVRDDLRAAVGTYYSLYKFDVLLDAERDHVRTYFLDLRYDREKAGKFRLRYELENDDFDQYHTVRLGWTTSF